MELCHSFAVPMKPFLCVIEGRHHHTTDGEQSTTTILPHRHSTTNGLNNHDKLHSTTDHLGGLVTHDKLATEMAVMMSTPNLFLSFIVQPCHQHPIPFACVKGTCESTMDCQPPCLDITSSNGNWFCNQTHAEWC